MAKKQKPERRKKGTGRVYEYPRNSGQWWAQLPERNGKAGRKWRVPNEETGEIELAEQLRQLEQGVRVYERSATVSGCVTYYIEKVAAVDGAKQKTLEGYRQKQRLYIDPMPLGHIRLSKLTTEDLREWKAHFLGMISAHTGKKYSALTIRNTWALLHAALSIAREDRKLSWDPPTRLRLPSAPEKKKQRALELALCNKLLKALEGRWLFVPIKFDLATGIRGGELIGLQQSAIDWDNNCIHLTTQLQLSRETGQWERTILKNNRSRDVFLDETLMDDLRMQITMVEQERFLQGSRWQDFDPDGKPWDLVFPSHVGTPMLPRNLLRDLNIAQERAGVPRTTIHELRHTAGSLMLAEHKTMTTVSEVLGHSSVGVTERVYAHSFPDLKRDAVSSVATQLRRRTKPVEEL